MSTSSFGVAAEPSARVFAESSVAAPVLVRHDAEFGEFWLRRLALPDDAPLIHSWVSRDYAAYWGLAGRSLEQVLEAYVEIARHADVYLGFLRDTPMFLVECYDPSQHEIGKHYTAEPGDRGMHVLVAPPETRRAGFTWAVFRTVMEFLFVDAMVKRVVVEPDVRNQRIHKLNLRAGFRYQAIVTLSNKVAHLAFCTRAHYFAAVSEGGAAAGAARSTLEHLQPQIWNDVNRELVCKAIAEFAHERLLRPELIERRAEWQRFAVSAEAGVEYRFDARLLPLNHWDIQRSSMEKTLAGQRVPLDALDFMIEFAGVLGIAAANLLVYLEEITSTLNASAYKRVHERFSASDLVHAGFQEVEAAMAEGHPVFVANSGRVGFDVEDYHRYAPEVAAPVNLIWVAARTTRAEVSCSKDLSYEVLLGRELGDAQLQRFRAELAGQGLDPDGYRFIPVHPWQWYEKLASSFAADIAARDLVCLGEGSDSYRPQQSIRTLFNASTPARCYVKTALSVLNMGFMRGLSADYMRGTPAINDWIAELIGADPYFSERRFGILREVAGLGYRKATFETALPKASPHRKMLAALFRESPIPKLREGERLLTMAALLHRDGTGAALLPLLIRASGLDVEAWLGRYLECYLAPLLHCFYQHDLAFMPHGENIVLVLERHVPVAVWLKDIAEEAAIMNTAQPLPEPVQRLAVAVPDELKTLVIFTDVFDGFLRFMAALLASDGVCSEDRFWFRVADCIATYQRAHPQYAERFERYDLFAPEFAHSCLNRLQLRNNRHMLDLADPVQGLAFAGTLENPIARFRPV